MKCLKALKTTVFEDWVKYYDCVFSHLGEYTFTDKLYRSFMNDAIRLEQRPDIIVNRGTKLENEVTICSRDDHYVKRVIVGILHDITYSKYAVEQDCLFNRYHADGIKAWIGKGYDFTDLQLYYYLNIRDGFYNAYTVEKKINIEYYYYIKPKEGMTNGTSRS